MCRMKCTIPEISWHNRDPVLSIDIQPGRNNDEGPYRLASGGTDSHVVIWYIHKKESGLAEIEFASDLQRHQRAVNVVRFSPTGELLASGDDEAVIIIWKQKTDQDAPELPSSENEGNREQWISLKTLRGHLEDIYDLSWSMDSASLISGSVDNSAIIWDVQKGKSLKLLKEHTGFVQGVSWDPKNKFVATMCSDRSCRIYNLNSKKVMYHINKAILPAPDGSELEGKTVRLFHDDTLKSFFRRLCFSPDGELLIVPSGFVEIPDTDKHFNATYIFTRCSLNRPVLYLPSPDQYTIAVRCCPVLFRLHEGDSVFALPYRIVIAVATQSSVMLYDTQQAEPFALISNIHYTRLTDVSWSEDGQILVVSSTDGYCSVITFTPGELGEVYRPSEAKSSDCDGTDKQNSATEKTGENSSELSSVQKGKESCKIEEPTERRQGTTATSNKSADGKSVECQAGDSSKTLKAECKTVSKENSSSNSELLCDTHGESNVSADASVLCNRTKESSTLREGKVQGKEVESSCMEVDANQTNTISEKENKDASQSDADHSDTTKNDRACSTVESAVIHEVRNESGSLTEKMCVADNERTEKSDEGTAEKSVTQKKKEQLEDGKTEALQAHSPPPPATTPCTLTPGNDQNRRTPRRVQLITLSSPKIRKKLIQ
ncbi:chromatin assembly factor 1 subunit B isoform X1 [Schistocerca cancellata]|uniref:chromatin assembly factor 1 subunit B isoform X1 n=2 Tax=Schistocerca cancellata TaxID=274614 RepID=UPI00211741F1|nr:chromatin assembly factor 1 subunit B isoform X1 [Schistocerca cancellata]